MHVAFCMYVLIEMKLNIMKNIKLQRNRNTVTIENAYGETDLRINSKLHLAPVTWKDSGQYSCMQPSTKADTIKLSVSEGMQLHNIFVSLFFSYKYD